MADALTIAGSFETVPGAGSSLSMDTVECAFDVRMMLTKKALKTVTLSTDLAFTVSLDGLDSVHALLIQSDAKVMAALTSADGSAAVVEVDGLFINTAYTTPYSAITLTRSPGITTNVRIFIGQRS